MPGDSLLGGLQETKPVDKGKKETKKSVHSGEQADGYPGAGGWGAGLQLTRVGSGSHGAGHGNTRPGVLTTRILGRKRKAAPAGRASAGTTGYAEGCPQVPGPTRLGPRDTACPRTALLCTGALGAGRGPQNWGRTPARWAQADTGSHARGPSTSRLCAPCPKPRTSCHAVPESLSGSPSRRGRDTPPWNSPPHLGPPPARRHQHGAPGPGRQWTPCPPSPPSPSTRAPTAAAPFLTPPPRDIGSRKPRSA